MHVRCLVGFKWTVMAGNFVPFLCVAEIYSKTCSQQCVADIWIWLFIQGELDPDRGTIFYKSVLVMHAKSKPYSKQLQLANQLPRLDSLAGKIMDIQISWHCPLSIDGKQLRLRIADMAGGTNRTKWNSIDKTFILFISCGHTYGHG